MIGTRPMTLLATVVVGVLKLEEEFVWRIEVFGHSADRLTQGR